MFWNKTNSKRIDELATEIHSIKLQLTMLKLDLELYANRLKAKKGIKTVKEELEEEEEQKTKDLYGGVLLPEHEHSKDRR